MVRSLTKCLSLPKKNYYIPLDKILKIIKKKKKSNECSVKRFEILKKGQKVWNTQGEKLITSPFIIFNSHKISRLTNNHIIDQNFINNCQPSTFDSGTKTATYAPGVLESSTPATPGTLNRYAIPFEKSPGSKNWTSLVNSRHAITSSMLNCMEGLWKRQVLVHKLHSPLQCKLLDDT